MQSWPASMYYMHYSQTWNKKYKWENYVFKMDTIDFTVLNSAHAGLSNKKHLMKVGFFKRGYYWTIDYFLSKSLEIYRY